MGIDQYNRITTSKIRMLRRIVRDAHFRGNSALNTISMWEDVLGQEKRLIQFLIGKKLIIL